VGKIDHALRREKPEFSHLDISAVSELDTAGRGWFGALPAMPMPVTGSTEGRAFDQRGQMLQRGRAHRAAARTSLVRIVETVGGVMIGLWRGTGSILAFLGALVSAFGACDPPSFADALDRAGAANRIGGIDAWRLSA
jgi:phospholipid/cholesterol/gamma-HCH transport system permease protein